MVLSAFLISELWTRVMLLLLFVICSCSESFQMVVAGIQRAFYIQNLLCFILNLDAALNEARAAVGNAPIILDVAHPRHNRVGWPAAVAPGPSGGGRRCPARSGAGRRSRGVRRIRWTSLCHQSCRSAERRVAARHRPTCCHHRGSWYPGQPPSTRCIGNASYDCAVGGQYPEWPSQANCLALRGPHRLPLA